MVLVLKGIVGLHRTIKFSFFSIIGQDIDLDYLMLRTDSFEKTLMLGKIEGRGRG